MSEPLLSYCLLNSLSFLCNPVSKPETRIVVSHRWSAHYSSCKTCFSSSATMTPPQHVSLRLETRTTLAHFLKLSGDCFAIFTRYTSSTPPSTSPTRGYNEYLPRHSSARGILCVQHTLHATYSARGILCARHSLHAAISACSILCACAFLVARNKEERKSNLVSWRVNLKLQRTP